MHRATPVKHLITLDADESRFDAQRTRGCCRVDTGPKRKSMNRRIDYIDPYRAPWASLASWASD